MFRLHKALFFLLLSSLALPPTHAATYNLPETGVVVPSVSACSDGNAINDSGVVAGGSYPHESASIGFVALRWQHGIITAIPDATPPFGDSGYDL